MEEEKKDVLEQPEEEKVEPIKEEAPKEELVQPEEPKQEEQAEDPKEEVKDNTLRIECGIDYDKLAEAIVRAQQKYDEIKEEELKHAKEKHEKLIEIDRQVKMPFYVNIKNVFMIFVGKLDPDIKTETMISSASSWMLNAMCFIIRVFAFVFGILSVNNYIQYDWWGSEIAMISGIISVIGSMILFVFMLYYAGILKCIAKRIVKEIDKNYVVAVFSAFTGFFALLVACVALLVTSAKGGF